MTIGHMAIQASDFSSSTRDELRNTWQEDNMGFLVQALSARPDHRVIITVNQDSGSAVEGQLVRVIGGYSGRSARIAVRYELSDGTWQTTNFLLPAIGPVIILAEDQCIESSKWIALRLRRDYQGAALRIFRAAYPETAGLTNTRTTVRFFGDFAQVYCRSEGFIVPSIHSDVPRKAIEAEIAREAAAMDALREATRKRSADESA